jgi:hypothetical protein
MRTVPRRFGSLTTLALGALACALSASAVTACSKGGGGGKKSTAARWVDSPSSGTKEGSVIKIPKLGVTFEIPDTLYVYRQCNEASHSAQGAEKWVPIITCSSTGSSSAAFGEEEDDDPWAREDEEESSGVETLDLTVFVTHKTRPLDERSIAWFENMYKQNGFSIDEISFQHDYQKKAGIYAKLHIIDQSTGTPTREIVQFMFPREDVVFIARMEYPFGEARSVEQDWKYILWNFNLAAGAAE